MRLFVAIPISEEIKDNLALVSNELKETGAELVFVSRENLHLTVKFLGDVAEKKVEMITQRLHEVAKECKKFSIEAKEVGVFPDMDNIRVIWVGLQSEELIQLLKKVNSMLRDIKEEQREELPHLTIARAKSELEKVKLAAVVKQLEHKEFGKMEVDKFVLFSSVLTHKGPVYTEVARFSIG